MVTRNQLGAPEGIPFGSVWLFVYAGISFSLVIFAGIMSGLTLAVILPVVQKQHQLLVTLLLCNAAAMEIDCRRGHDSYSPIESTFSLDVNSKLDWEAMGKILALGHRRVPVYSGNPKNIIGLLLGKGKMIPKTTGEGTYEENIGVGGDSRLTTPLLQKQNEMSENVVANIDKFSRPPSINKSTGLQRSDSQTNGSFSDNIEDEVIGIITLEDVFEELLQEEIVDETDEYVDVHKSTGSINPKIDCPKGSWVWVRAINRGQSGPQSGKEWGAMRHKKEDQKRVGGARGEAKCSQQLVAATLQEDHGGSPERCTSNLENHLNKPYNCSLEN
ncbi:hypothetical protein JHK87_036804 [Glycine soja]|nr:hypothetical protein JHK87_036804 [Glycine soja]